MKCSRGVPMHVQPLPWVEEDVGGWKREGAVGWRGRCQLGHHFSQDWACQDPVFSTNVITIALTFPE